MIVTETEAKSSWCHKAWRVCRPEPLPMATCIGSGCMAGWVESESSVKARRLGGCGLTDKS